jgi:preprotein translocase subunit SecF
MKYKYIYFGISLLVLIPGTVSLIKNGLKLSIDFTGGTLLEVQTSAPNAFETIKKLKEVSSVQKSEDNTYLLRMHEINNDQKNKLIEEMSKELRDLKEKRFETVGPVIGKELTQKAVVAVIVASIAIIFYIAWSFKDWKFGMSAVLALIHDALVVLGVFSLLGVKWGVEIDVLFVTAVLTVIGFSVHDTIVVFDRIRENLPKMPKVSFSEVTDFSLTETLVRSLNTSITVLLTLLALLLFGGETIRWFIVALLVGIFSGTYSSIFNAAPLLVLWERR